MRMLRPLRLFVPFVAVGAALLVFLVFGFLAYQGARWRPRRAGGV